MWSELGSKAVRYKGKVLCANHKLRTTPPDGRTNGIMYFTDEAAVSIIEPPTYADNGA